MFRVIIVLILCFQLVLPPSVSTLAPESAFAKPTLSAFKKPRLKTPHGQFLWNFWMEEQSANIALDPVTSRVHERVNNFRKRNRKAKDYLSLSSSVNWEEHDFIWALFPTLHNGASGLGFEYKLPFSFKSHLLDDSEVSKEILHDILIFRQSSSFKKILRENFNRYMYHIGLVYNENDESLSLRKHGERAFQKYILAGDDHNLLRITRVINSLYLFGEDRRVLALKKMLEKNMPKRIEANDRVWKENYWDTAFGTIRLHEELSRREKEFVGEKWSESSSFGRGKRQLKRDPHVVESPSGGSREGRISIIPQSFKLQKDHQKLLLEFKDNRVLLEFIKKQKKYFRDFSKIKDEPTGKVLILTRDNFEIVDIVGANRGKVNLLFKDNISSQSFMDNMGTKQEEWSLFQNKIYIGKRADELDLTHQKPIRGKGVLFKDDEMPLVDAYSKESEMYWLSNFYGKKDGSPLFYTQHNQQRLGWPTVEHYFQAMKFYNTNQNAFDAIRNAPSPREALARARKHRMTESQIISWDKSLRYNVMRKALWEKFSQNPDLKTKLMKLEGVVIVESSDVDPHWGILPKDNYGHNLLGRFQMELVDYWAKKGDRANQEEFVQQEDNMQGYGAAGKNFYFYKVKPHLKDYFSRNEIISSSNNQAKRYRHHTESGMFWSFLAERGVLPFRYPEVKSRQHRVVYDGQFYLQFYDKGERDNFLSQNKAFQDIFDKMPSRGPQNWLMIKPSLRNKRGGDYAFFYDLPADSYNIKVKNSNARKALGKALLGDLKGGNGWSFPARSENIEIKGRTLRGWGCLYEERKDASFKLIDEVTENLPVRSVKLTHMREVPPTPWLYTFVNVGTRSKRDLIPVKISRDEGYKHLKSQFIDQGFRVEFAPLANRLQGARIKSATDFSQSVNGLEKGSVIFIYSSEDGRGALDSNNRIFESLSRNA